MKIRFASLFAAVALAATAVPAFAQGAGDPPPLPDEQWQEEWGNDYPSGPDETGVSWNQEWRGQALPPQAYGQYPRAYGGYTPEQRATWLEQCWRTYEPRDECEAILDGYERGYAPGPAYGYGGHGYGAPAHGAYGYGAWPPVMWVKVPIVTKHRHGAGCGCQQVVEEVIEQEVIAPAPQKRVKIQRVVPAPTKTTKITRYSK